MTDLDNLGIRVPRFCAPGVLPGTGCETFRKRTNMSRKAVFNDVKLQSLKPAPKGKRREYPDLGESGSDGVRGLVIRVTDKGHKSFVLIARYPGKVSQGEKTAGKTYPERRALGSYPEMSLAEAREKARAWRALIAKGLDPSEEESRQRAAAAEHERTASAKTFGAAVERYLERRIVGKVKSQKQGKFVADTLRREFVNDFPRGKAVRSGLGSLPLTEIKWLHIKERLDDAHDRGKPYAARHLLAIVRTFLNWAVDEGTYGIEYNVSLRKKARVPQPRRTRTLSDDELRALWTASGQLGTFGLIIRFLCLTLQRRSDVAQLQWREIDAMPTPADDEPATFDPNSHRRVFTIPAHKFKMKEPVAVYLSDRALAILDELPKGKSADYAFSAVRGGARPFNGFSFNKKKLDALMLAHLKEAAAAKGEDPESVILAPWKIHDIRRVGRSALSKLRVRPEVAEAVIGHAKRGIERVYDRYDLWDEKVAAMTAWSNYVAKIVGEAPMSSNVVEMRSVVR